MREQALAVAAVVYIFGCGPTDTKYADAAADPRKRQAGGSGSLGASPARTAAT